MYGWLVIDMDSETCAFAASFLQRFQTEKHDLPTVDTAPVLRCHAYITDYAFLRAEVQYPNYLLVFVNEVE